MATTSRIPGISLLNRERMSGIDTAWLRMEHPTNHHHTAREESEGRADHQQRAEQDVAFVNVPEPRHHAQGRGGLVTRSAPEAAPTVARHPIALEACVWID